MSDSAPADPFSGRAEQRARLDRLKSNPDTVDVIYEHVANGGTLISLCETWDVRYSEIMKWIDDDPARQKKYKDGLMARNEWADEAWFSELSKIMRFDIRTLYRDNGSLKDISQLDSDTARMVQSTEVNDLFEGRGAEREKVGETKKVKLWDKLKAMELLGKNRRLVVDRVSHEGSIKLEDLVGRSMESAPVEPPPSAPANAPAPEAPVPSETPKAADVVPSAPAPAPAAEVQPAPAEAPKPQA